MSPARRSCSSPSASVHRSLPQLGQWVSDESSHSPHASQCFPARFVGRPFESSSKNMSDIAEVISRSSLLPVTARVVTRIIAPACDTAVLQASTGPPPSQVSTAGRSYTPECSLTMNPESTRSGQSSSYEKSTGELPRSYPSTPQYTKRNVLNLSRSRSSSETATCRSNQSMLIEPT